MAVWLTKTSGTDRCFFRASHQASEVHMRESVKYFDPDRFNSDGGVFRSLLAVPLAVPLAAWNEKMVQISGKIDPPSSTAA